MRKLYSASKICNSNCKYCFANWNDIYSRHSSFTTEAIDDKKAIIYPCCDGEFFMQRISIDEIKSFCESMEKVYVSISTKNLMTSEMIQTIVDLNDYLRANKKGFVKFSISITTSSSINEIEPNTLPYHERLNLLNEFSKTDVPLSVTIKPILPFIPTEEYINIIDDCSNYVSCVLLGGLYVNRGTDFFKEYIEGQYKTVMRNVSWLPNNTNWEYVLQDDKIRDIARYVKTKGMSVFESDVDLIESLI